MEILCIKHVGFEGPAAIAVWAQDRGHNLTIAPIYSEPHLPAPATFDALIIMGGPMNVYEDDKYPWLAREKTYIRGAIAAGKPVFGVCLGAQLIAHALGARVYAGEHKEIGWFPIRRDSEYPDDCPLPDQLTAYHWHGDTFDLPKGAQRIASSDVCLNQGFRYHANVFALQYHLEVYSQSLTLLSAACANELAPAPYIQTAERMQSEPAKTYEAMHEALFAMLDGWAK
ncbi:MAG: type 1 glutamine amidotransferase [Opitutales bacterium]|nr:type 1 glutamine amidotransferase [Opitutales bacterium]